MSVIPVIDVTPKKKVDDGESWWERSDGELNQGVTAIINSIQKNQSYRRADNLRYARLYANKDFDQFISGTVSNFFGKRLTFNVIRSCVDTAAAKISKSRPRPYFLTSNGNFSQQRRAKGLTKYIDGTFQSGKVHSIGKRCFKDCGVFGTGAMKIFPHEKQVRFERVFIDEILVDDVDGRDGFPRQLHQVKLTHRNLLEKLYPEKKMQIESAVNAAKTMTKSKTISDMVEIRESWHLPSGQNAGDGRHLISIDGCDLEDNEYEKNYFPFVFQRWNPSVLGFYGDGLASEIVGIQLEINLILMRIKEALELVAVPRVLIEEGSNVSSNTITDEIGGILRYRGTKPDFHTPVGMNRETYDYLEYLYRKAFEDSGISQLSASSKKPVGLDSGVAIREYQDIETERFALVGEMYQDFYMDAAEVTIDVQRDIEKESKGSSVKVPGKDFIETIKWKDVDLPDDKFVMQPYPTNLLPKTPEGQLQFTQELIQSGFIDPEEGLSLLNFPDLQGFFNLRTAAIDDVKLILEKMIEEEVYTPPEPFMDLNLCVRLTQSAYLRAKTNGTSEISMEYMRRFIIECQELLAPPPQMMDINQDSLPNPVAPGVAKPLPLTPGAIAQPAPAPVSELLPIQPPQ